MPEPVDGPVINFEPIPQPEKVPPVVKFQAIDPTPPQTLRDVKFEPIETPIEAIDPASEAEKWSQEGVPFVAAEFAKRAKLPQEKIDELVSHACFTRAALLEDLHRNPLDGDMIRQSLIDLSRGGGESQPAGEFIAQILGELKSQQTKTRVLDLQEATANRRLSVFIDQSRNK